MPACASWRVSVPLFLPLKRLRVWIELISLRVADVARNTKDTFRAATDASSSLLYFCSRVIL